MQLKKKEIKNFKKPIKIILIFKFIEFINNYSDISDKSWAIQAQDYVKKGRVTDYKYGLKLTEMFKNPKMDLSRLFFWGK